ncbi:MAG: hypothetical protein ACPG52_08820 [Cognaticolwellia sp.]
MKKTISTLVLSCMFLPNAEANISWPKLDRNSSSYKYCTDFSKRYHLIANKEYTADPDNSNKFHSPVINKSKEDTNNWYCVIEETVTSYYQGKPMMSFNQEATFVIDKKSQKFTQQF